MGDLWVEEDAVIRALREAEELGLIDSFVGPDGVQRFLMTSQALDYVVACLRDERRTH